MLKKIFEKPAYVVLVGALNLVSTLWLATIMVNLHDPHVLMGFIMLIVLNLGVGLNNFVFGLRAMKRLSKA